MLKSLIQGAHKNFLDTNSNVARMDNFKLQDEEEHGNLQVFNYSVISFYW